jgi:hypothetical protein
MRPEETIEKKFVEECTNLDVLVYKFEIRGTRGAPDRIVFLPNGKTIFVEFKVPLARLSPHQVKFIKQLQMLRHEVLVATDWETPLKRIKEILNGKRN